MSRSQSHSLRAGFTLVELMVAIAVLSIILVATGQILSTTATLTTVNNKHMDANDQSRMVFDRMADDFARMVRRKDVDYIFWKAGGNDVMYFYTEGASYFDSTTFSLASGYTAATGGYMAEKNPVSLVGYRVNNTPAAAAPLYVAPYYQLERLGKALSWDGGAYNSGQSANNSKQPNFMVFLTYPSAGTDVQSVGAPDSTVPYSTAFFNSTLAGAFSNNSPATRHLNPATPTANQTPTVGTEAKAFNDSTDTSYRTVGSQVFRFEYAFQLKDGTLSDVPIMYASGTNGIPSSNFTSARPITGANQRPLPTNDSSTTGGSWSIGSRWWDSTNHIGYICLDATPNAAIWHEIGIQDVSAIIVTIAVIDKQGLTFVNANSGDLSKIAAKLLDYSPTVTWPTSTSPAGNPAYLLDPTQTTGWAYALLPTRTVSTTAITGTIKLPQSMISQIRLYQRYFYLNTY